MDVTDRNVVFITHANPEDNPFAIWLGARLASAGYEVWADVLSLRGGNDWSKLLENAIRHRACKVLFAANQSAANKRA
ncbi:MAG: toll/interleukin-1 receptor domain-containing protein [Candidatus Acidiferrales bacterium]